MKHTHPIPTLFLTLATSLTACVGGSDDLPPVDLTALQAFILPSPPPNIQHKLGIDYDGKLVLLGYDIKPDGEVERGEHVKLTMYWSCKKKLSEPDWRLFTHILDGAGARVLNIDNVGPLRRLHGATQILAPSAWEAGKVYVDEQDFVLPSSLKTDTAQITVGVWRGNERLGIVAGPKDNDNRGIVATLRMKAAKPGGPPIETRVPELRVDRLDKKAKLKIDGKLDEPEWKTAPSTGAFVNVRTGQPSPDAPVSGTARLLWSSEAFFIGFEVRDEDVVGGFGAKDKDPHLWTKDTVEVMIDPDGDGDNRDYYEIQINPQNLVFDSHFDTYNQPKTEPDGPFGHQDWSSKLQSAVVVQGTLDKSSDKDEGYVIEAKLPWKSFAKAKHTPPELGDVWRMNFYAMENNGGVAWSPILGQGNFHRASRFGKVLWAEAGWQPPAPAAAPPGAEGTPAAAAPGATPAQAPATAPAAGTATASPAGGAPKDAKGAKTTKGAKGTQAATPAAAPAPAGK